MVEKLGFKIEKHSCRQKLSWLLKGSEINLDKNCLIFFSIGQNYTYEIWYDVPMDACHLLLGCLYKYNRKTIHGGYKDTYYFVKDGIKIVLGPYNLEELLNFLKKARGRGGDE